MEVHGLSIDISIIDATSLPNGPTGVKKTPFTKREVFQG